MHRIDWFTDNTDPKLVFFEPDTMHTLAGRGRFPDPVDGRLFDVNAWYGRLAEDDRLIAWHIKDADRVIPLPAPGTNPFTQTRLRPGFPSTTAPTSSTPARARSPADTQSTPTPR